MERIEHHACFGGWQEIYQHESATLGCTMNVAVYLPPQAEKGRVPVLYWLSGLTCTEQNVITKSGVQRYAAEHGIAIVAPDSSPRGEKVADNHHYDLGQGAGFYVNATQKPWAANYQMYDYVVQELPDLIEAHFPVTQERSISGHSMGGHGALVIGMRNPNKFVSVSAFSPIANPCDCPWGRKALGRYLGDDKEAWKEYDASLLLASKTHSIPLLVEQGTKDEFLHEQLKPQALVHAAQQSETQLTLNMHEGYDHSYFFIASFIEEHLEFHAGHMGLI